MCFSGKCDFETFDGDCDLYRNHEDIVKLFDELHLDYCAYGHRVINNTNSTEENNTIKFILNINNITY